MAWREMELMKWAKALVDGKDVNGDSPGGAAARLGVSRQYIHKLIDDDVLDAIRVTNKGRLAAIVLNETKLALYEKARPVIARRRA